MDIEVLDPGENPLPPTLYDIAGLTPLFKAKADYTVKGQYLFRKADYQRFFGRTVYYTGLYCWITREHFILSDAV